MKRVLLVICVLSVGGLAWAQSPPLLGSAATFAVLGSSNVTCTAPGMITGDVGVTSGSFTNATGCTIVGGTPPATNAAAALGHTAFLNAYDALVLTPCTQTIATAAFTGNVPAMLGPFPLGNIPPGVYCFPAAVTSNGAQACNVFWAVGAAATLSTSTLPPLFQGNILAGGPAGSITITGGNLIGRVLANVAVTLTGTNINGVCALVDQAKASCKNDDEDDDRDKDHHDGDDDRDRDHHEKGKHHHDR